MLYAKAVIIAPCIVTYLFSAVINVGSIRMPFLIGIVALFELLLANALHLVSRRCSGRVIRRGTTRGR